MDTTASMTPFSARFSARWTPAGTGGPRAPRRPSARGSRPAPPARRRSRGPASPRTRRRLRSWGGAGAPGRAARRAVRHHRPRDRDHLVEGRGPLLHPGAARGGRGQEGQALRRGPSYAGHDALAGRLPDRPAQEGELVDDRGDRPAADQPAAGEHGLVGARALGRGPELRLVGLGVPADVDRLVPGLERPGSSTRSISPRADQRWLIRGSAPRSQARTASPCSSSAGGAACERRVTSVPSASKNRSGGPGSVTGPRTEWSTSISRPWLAVWSQP